ncbi:hypothetical protein AB7M49_005402, partial [Bradyrhizobium elkanii]
MAWRNASLIEKTSAHAGVAAKHRHAMTVYADFII